MLSVNSLFTVISIYTGWQHAMNSMSSATTILLGADKSYEYLMELYDLGAVLHVYVCTRWYK